MQKVELVERLKRTVAFRLDPKDMSPLALDGLFKHRLEVLPDKIEIHYRPLDGAVAKVWLRGGECLTLEPFCYVMKSPAGEIVVTTESELFDYWERTDAPDWGS